MSDRGRVAEGKGVQRRVIELKLQHHLLTHQRADIRIALPRNHKIRHILLHRVRVVECVALLPFDADLHTAVLCARIDIGRDA